MNLLNRTITCGLLAGLAVAARAADDQIRLVADQSTQSLRLEAGRTGFVVLVLGPLAVPPIAIGGITLDVVPHHLLSLGVLEAGDVHERHVSRLLSGLSAEAVLFDFERGTLHDSNVIGLVDVFADLIDATFRAELVSTDSIPPYYTVGAALTAPTSGHDFVVDGHQLDGNIMHVYLRLITPTEIVLPVLTDHRVTLDLGSEVGSVVHVHMMQIARGEIGPEVYQRMAVLPVAGDLR